MTAAGGGPGADGYDVVIDAEAYDGPELVSRREWSEHVPRSAGR